MTAIRAIVSEKGSALRILGLSATPGSQPAMVEEVIDNLLCSKVCFFGDDDPELLPHRHERQTDVVVLQATNDASACMREIREVQYSLLCNLRRHEAFDHCVPERATHYALIQAKKAYNERRAGTHSCQYVSDTSPCYSYFVSEWMVLSLHDGAAMFACPVCLGSVESVPARLSNFACLVVGQL